MRKVPRGTFECVTEFVDGPNFDGRNVEMHFHDVLTDEYTSYNVSLPSSWCAASTVQDLVDAFVDEYARTRPEKGMRGDLRLSTTTGAVLGTERVVDDVVRHGMLLLVAPAAAVFKPFTPTPGHEAALREDGDTPEALGLWRCRDCRSPCLEWETRCWECGASRDGAPVPKAKDTGWSGDGEEPVEYQGPGWVCKCKADCLSFEATCWRCGSRKNYAA